MRALLVGSLMIVLSSVAIAADGFRVFEFGDDVETVLTKGQSLCRFDEVYKDTRWPWKSYVECRGFDFKDGILVKLYFDFTDMNLVKILVVSKDIPEYKLLRNGDHKYLVPLAQRSDPSSLKNVADRLILRDKVHKLKGEFKYTTFFYNGNWEWEYQFEKPGNEEEEKSRKQEQQEDEKEKGLTGWTKFEFGDSNEKTKQKLEGMCTAIKVISGKQNTEVVRCSDFVFLKNKVTAQFTHQDSKLVKVELLLNSDWYDRLLPLLKKKYGFPYIEVAKSKIYHPYIEFPRVNVVMSHKPDPSLEKPIWVSLVYLQDGYDDVEIEETQSKGKTSPIDEKQSALEEIIDSI